MSGPLATPDVTAGLLHYGLITEEEADEGYAKWDKEYARLTQDDEWWARLAIISWRNEVHWLRRWWDGHLLWTYRWIRARRGW